MYYFITSLIVHLQSCFDWSDPKQNKRETKRIRCLINTEEERQKTLRGKKAPNPSFFPLSPKIQQHVEGKQIASIPLQRPPEDSGCLLESDPRPLQRPRVSSRWLTEKLLSSGPSPLHQPTYETCSGSSVRPVMCSTYAHVYLNF